MSTEVEVVSFSLSSKIIWKIKNFSGLNSVVKFWSEVFSVGSFKWKVRLFPKGNGKLYDHLSLFLVPVDLTEPVDAQFSFAISSQTDSKNNRVKKTGKYLEFSDERGWGWLKFIKLRELHDPDKGYIVNYTCVITIDVTCRMEEDTISDDLREADPDKVLVTEANKKAKLIHGVSSTLVGECPSAGQPFGEGHHNYKVVGFGDEKEFEDVGGFSILKTQAPLYKQIWLKYGHIPTIKVMPISSYALLVMAVKDLMNSIIDMHQCRYVELSSEMVERWEQMLKMAEKLEFNIGWLRERLESVRNGLGGMQKAETELLEHGRPLRAAKSRVQAAGDELKKAEMQLIAVKEYLQENISGLLSELDMEMYLDIGENLLLDGLF
ncbi:hypothetical protein MKX01_020401 [Papaver californicum]|nr:hypothetical protein MKX01_020401 [Papaver californicum]